MSAVPVPSDPDFLRAPKAAALCAKLRAMGFVIAPGGRSKSSENVGTVRVNWSGIYVGYIRKDLLSKDRLLGYQFNPGMPESGNAAPRGFEKTAFCLEHGLDPQRVHIHPDAGKEYLSVYDEADAIALMQGTAAKLETALFAGSGRDDPDEIAADDQRIDADASLSPATRKALRDARRGQGKFRADLDAAFESACACTGLNLRAALRASHIVAYSDLSTNDQERLDADNGLLLSANLDALFDRYLITFGERGALILGASITHQHLALLGPACGLQSQPTSKRRAYLRRHNEEFERREKARRVAATRG